MESSKVLFQHNPNTTKSSQGTLFPSYEPTFKINNQKILPFFQLILFLLFMKKHKFYLLTLNCQYFYIDLFDIYYHYIIFFTSIIVFVVFYSGLLISLFMCVLNKFVLYLCVYFVFLIQQKKKCIMSS